MTPLELINLYAPEYSGNTSLNDFISEAEKETGTAYGDLRNKAIALLVLHWLVIQERKGIAGNIASEKEGDLSVSYNVSSMGNSALNQTSWGCELIELRKSSIFAVGNRFII